MSINYECIKTYLLHSLSNMHLMLLNAYSMDKISPSIYSIYYLYYLYHLLHIYCNLSAYINLS
jgi:hypothetical protein